MTEGTIGQGSAGGEQGAGGSQFNDGGGWNGTPNPAWNDILGTVPQEYHSRMYPILSKMDQGVQDRFQKVHSSYEPYKEFVDNGVDADNIRVALGLAQALEEQPEMVYQALAQEYGQQGGPEGGDAQQFQAQLDKSGLGEGQGGSGEPDFDGVPPQFVQQFQQMQEQVNVMRDIMLGQKQQEDEKSEDAELEALYQNINKESPLFAELNKEGKAEPYINSLLIAGYDEKQAIEAFSDFVDTVASYHNRPKPPQIMGSGGFMPNQQVRPRDLSEKQTKEMMVQMLRAAHHQD